MAMMLDESEASDRRSDRAGARRRQGAFGRLVERHYDFIYRVAWRWAGNRADAEDIAQDVCVRLGRAIRSYRGGGAFTTWLYAMTLNAARDLRRKTARENVKTEAFGVHALMSGGDAAGSCAGRSGRTALGRGADASRTSSATPCCWSMAKGLSHAAAADAMAMRGEPPSPGTSMKRRNG